MADEEGPVAFESQDDFDRMSEAVKWVEGEKLSDHPHFPPSPRSNQKVTVKVTGAKGVYFYPGKIVYRDASGNPDIASPNAYYSLDGGDGSVVWVTPVNGDESLIQDRYYQGIPVDLYQGQTVVLVTAAGTDVIWGVLDGNLDAGSSATLSVWSWNGSAFADTGVNVTVYDRFLAAGMRVGTGAKISAFKESRSDRYYAQVRPNQKVRGTLTGTLSYGGSASFTIQPTGVSVTVYDCLLSSGQTAASGKNGTAFWSEAEQKYFLDNVQCV